MVRAGVTSTRPHWMRLRMDDFDALIDALFNDPEPEPKPEPKENLTRLRYTGGTPRVPPDRRVKRQGHRRGW